MCGLEDILCCVNRFCGVIHTVWCGLLRPLCDVIQCFDIISLFEHTGRSTVCSYETTAAVKGALARAFTLDSCSIIKII